LNDPVLLSTVEELARSLTRRTLRGSYPSAMNTLHCLYKVIQQIHFDSCDDLIRKLQCIGRILGKASYTELAVGNILRRVIHIVSVVENECDEKTSVDDIRANVLSDVEEVLLEIDRGYSHIADQAIEHIHVAEIILTVGRSRTVLSFLVEAAKLRDFQAVVVECAPSLEGQTMALQLAKENIETTHS